MPTRLSLYNALKSPKALPWHRAPARDDQEALRPLSGNHGRRELNGVINDLYFFDRNAPCHHDFFQILRGHDDPRRGLRDAGLHFLQIANKNRLLWSFDELIKILLDAKTLAPLLPRVVADYLHDKRLPCPLCRLHRRESNRDGVERKHSVRILRGTQNAIVVGDVSQQFWQAPDIRKFHQLDFNSSLRQSLKKRLCICGWPAHLRRVARARNLELPKTVTNTLFLDRAMRTQLYFSRTILAAF